ncbi:dehydrogenase [Desulfuribacillus stibiiarsenatis]|uniref:Dehydrogenase n=1 Tax=Desulfuribacillus stibiiarsenatis TaxID=1390249 RepID=A0A1E5L8Z2_9FIRM|nr:molybdopterin-dependent oxidoreductase [Desulfuribacillus stibiiarsenatis]OEH86622.1 dehydrogenase [Desulfuribacillus stibiiarsenatis]
MEMNRRSFIKATAISSATIVSGSLSLKYFSEKARAQGDINPETQQGEWKPSTCQGCTSWCPVQVYIVNQRAVKVMGNTNARANRWNVCPRGHMALQQMYDPDRLKGPMKRTYPVKGKGIDPQFVPITWDEAMDTIAEKMIELRNENESHKFMLLRGRYSFMRDIIYEALPKIYGTPNNISHSSICAEAEKFGSYYTEGFWDYRDYDLLNTRYVLAWGADPISSNRQVPHAINVWGQVLDRAKVAVVDPRLSATAAKAKIWLPVIPGEDGALAVAIAHVILTEGLWNKEFVGDFIDQSVQFDVGKEVDEASFKENYTFGVVKWWNIELKDKTPEWASERTGISPETIYNVAREFAAAAPHSISWVSPGASMQVRGGYTAMAAHALNGLVGSVDNVGGTLQGMKVPDNTIPKFTDYQDEIALTNGKKKKMDHRGTKVYPSLKDGKSGGGSIINQVADSILTDDPYDIKMAIGYWNNFTFSCSGASRWEQAMEKIPFFAHITTNISEMSQYADIVLPSGHQMFEKWGYVKSKYNRVSYATLNQPVLDNLWDVKMDETEIPWMLAEKLAEKGFDNLYRYYSTEFIDPETGDRPKNGLEFSLISLKMLTQPMWDPTLYKTKDEQPPIEDESWDIDEKERRRRWSGDFFTGWENFREVGVWNSSDYIYRSKWGNFNTSTSQFEFYSETLKDALKKHAEKHVTTIDDVLETTKYQARGEVAFVPHYEEAYRWGNEEEFPFIFFEHRSRLNREGRSQNLTWYYAHKDVDPGDERWDDVVKINPIDASKIGVNNGDTVKIISPVGEISCHAKLWEGIRPGTIAKCYGQGHWAYGALAAKDFQQGIPRGGNNNLILPADYDRLSGSTARHGGVTRVKIVKI